MVIVTAGNKKGPAEWSDSTGPETGLIGTRQMIIFHFAQLPVNDNFAAGLNVPAVVRNVEAPIVPTVFTRTRDDEPTDEKAGRS